VTDSEAFPVLSGRLTEKSGQHRQTAYDTRLCHDELRRKISALILPEKARVTGPVNMQTVTVQLRISG
jgi:hypothetical protein